MQNNVPKFRKFENLKENQEKAERKRTLNLLGLPMDEGDIFEIRKLINKATFQGSNFSLGESITSKTFSKRKLQKNLAPF